MLSRILQKISGNYNEKELQRLRQTVHTINQRDAQYDALSNDAIKAKTPEFKQRILDGATLDDILPEAFAVVKQACKRLVGQDIVIKGETIKRNIVPYDVQLIGGIALHQGRISEMKTGEGKTLVASLPAYLNALTGKWVHVVTVNDYLADRDAQWMKPIYHWLGLTIGTVVKWIAVNARKSQYECDITYVENSELWFDYLRDNLVKSISQRVLLRRKLNYAIIDEIDSILIDEARTPLIISEPDQEPTDKYEYYGKIVKVLIPSKTKKKVSKGFLQEMISDKSDKEADASQDGDYYIDEKTKTASLSSQGIKKLEDMLGVKNIYQDLGYQEIHHIENALKAYAVYHEDKDYIINDGEVIIVDQNTGRAMQGRRFSEGLHQAIEAKHQLTIQRESKTLATITYQNFFKIYEKLSGMTGTAGTEGEEFDKIYELSVLTIPTHKPTIRVDHHDRVYFNQQAKWNFVLDHVQFAHQVGQPVLIGTSSINTSEFVSHMLQKHNLTHSVLNAKYHEQEANIVANAGKYKSIMVATNMAGRGTDIKLESGLNEKLATNYAQWIMKNLDGTDPLAQKKGEACGIIATIYSEKEFEYTLKGLQASTWLTDEQIQQASKDRTIFHNNHTIKIRYNTRKKQPHEAHAQLMFMPANNNNATVISKEFHYGLYIIGTEKHESRRIDNQLRGRAGRQGDPGASVFYVALDDALMQKMGGQQIQTVAALLMPNKEEREKLELTQKQFTNAIIRAQKQMEGRHFGIRKHLFDYDSVINKQRMRIYDKRDNILFTLQQEEQSLKDAANNTNENTQITQDMTKENAMFSSAILQEIEQSSDEVIRHFMDNHLQVQTPKNEIIPLLKKEYNLTVSDDFFSNNTYESLHVQLTTHINQYLETISNTGKTPQAKMLIHYTLANMYLNIIDRNWIDHIDTMQHLRDKVGLMGYAKQDPLIMYKQEAFEKFQSLLHTIKHTTLVNVLNTNFVALQEQQEQFIQQQAQHRAQQADQQLLGKLKNLAATIPAGAAHEQQVQKEKAQTTKQQMNYSDEDGVEVFEVGEETAATQPTNKKLRPNDKVTVKYTNGQIEYDVKYKKVKDDIESGACIILKVTV